MRDNGIDAGRGERACHVPVMAEEAVTLLVTPDTGLIVDATVGQGGHAEALMEAAPADCRLVGIDLDDDAIAFAGRRLARFGDRVLLMKMNYGDMLEMLPSGYAGSVDALLVDCGISGRQIVTSDRGFSFDRDGSLDMRFNASGGATAAEVLEGMDADGLTALLREFGEGKQAKRLARSILESRDAGDLESTLELARAVKAVARHKPARTLARVFLALRATVNSELESLARLMESLPELISSGGRVCVITYHSLEDRIVKRALRKLSGRCVCPPGTVECSCGRAPLFRVLTPRPLGPRPDEVIANKSARSAKMRAAVKTA